jgi:cystathionine gamma-synthase/methionine-gamma-lyase
LLADEVGRLDDALSGRTKMVFFETPTNPSMDVIDIVQVARVAKKARALTVVDNTFATPVNQNPLGLGADLVVHSATKYLGGHSDLTGGAVIGSKELLEPIWTWRKNLGQMLAPEVAFLLSRSIRTLVVRVRAQNATAQRVAEFLDAQPRVVRVNYPGLDGGSDTCRRQMCGFGGMLSFVYDGSAHETAAFVDRLRLFSIAASLGGVESLVTQPITTTHHGMTAEERARRGIVDGLVRLSCGLEDADDLVADLQQAFE